MRRVAKVSLLLAPLLVAGASGCSTPGFMSASKPLDSRIARLDRLLSVAAEYENEGRHDAAMSVYQHVLAQNPENSFARQRFDTLAQNQVTPAARDLQKNLHRQQLYPATPDVLVASKRTPRPNQPIADQTVVAQKTESAPQESAKPTLAEKTAESSVTQVVAQSTKTEISVLEKSLATTTTTSTPSPEITPEPVYSHLDWALSQANRKSKSLKSEDVVEVATSAPEFIPEANKVAAEVAAKEEPVSDDAWYTTELAHHQPPKASEHVIADEWEPTRLITLCNGLPEDLHAAVQLLESKDPVEQVDGLRELAASGERAKPAAVAIHALLEHPNPVVAVHAASALRETANDAWASVQTLTSYLKHEDEQVVRLACYLLGQIGPEAMDAVPSLEAVRESSDLLSSLHAAEALTHIAPDDRISFEKLNAALTNKERSIRWFAAVSLGTVSEQREKEAVEALVKALRDNEPQVQAAACLSLGGLGQQASIAISDLEKAAQSESAEVKQAAETALACLRG